MLGACHEVITDVGWLQHVSARTRISGQGRRCLDPVFIARVNIHDQWAGIGSGTPYITTVGLAAQGIGRGRVREREHGFDVEMILSIALRTAILCKAVVDAQSITPAYPVEDTVEDFFSIQVLVKAEPDEVIQ